MSTAIVSMDELQKAAAVIVKSKLFGIETAEQAMSIMLIAQAEGRPAALAVRDYHVIKGRPALKADAMLARFQQEGGVVEWEEYGDKKVSGKFSHPKSCPVPVKVEWTIEMAQRIGLAGRDNWRNYPRAMLRARVISEGVRTTYPGIAVGIYTVEEVQDLQKEKDITPTAGAGDQLNEAQRITVAKVAEKMRDWLEQGSLTDAFAEMDNAALDTEEQVFLWTFFDSRARRQLKEEGERQRIRQKALESKLISDAQKKRLEARIGELKLDRDQVKEFCKERFLVEHFADLTVEQYETLDSQLESMAPKAAAEHGGRDTLAAPSQEGQTAGLAPSAALQSLETALSYAPPVTRNRLMAKLAAKGVRSLSELTDEQIAPLKDWVQKEIDKAAEKTT